MSCRYGETEINDYIDGTLVPADREAFEAHLGRCDACSKSVETLRLIVRQAQALEPIDPDETLRHSVRAELEKRYSQRPAQEQDSAAKAPSSSAGSHSRRSEIRDAGIGGHLAGGTHAPFADLTDGSPSRAPATLGEEFGGSAQPRRLHSAWLAAAAALILVLLGGAWAMGRWSASSGSNGPSGVAGFSSSSELEGDWTQVRADYDAMSAALEREFSQARSQLPDDVLAEVDRTLRMLDEAITDLQHSTADQNSDQESLKQLTALYRKKMELLWKTSVLASAGQRT